MPFKGAASGKLGALPTVALRRRKGYFGRVKAPFGLSILVVVHGQSVKRSLKASVGINILV